jgi:glutamyl-tRNA synthetase
MLHGPSRARVRLGKMHRGSTDLPVRVRLAPSPTGALHLGSALVAVANAAFARTMGGTFVLRIDDTDQSRSRDEDSFELLRLLRWLGLDWDEGPIHQHDRDATYRAALDRLEQAGHAYPCFCGDTRLARLRSSQRSAGQPPRYDGRCRELDATAIAAALDEGAPHVLRFRVPDDRDVEFEDVVHGPVRIPAGSFGDPVLYRSDASAGYLFASVVDDIEMGITYVVRGEDHLTNTARQLLLFEALGAEYVPAFAHLPLLRDEQGRKLSKRDPFGTLNELADEGFLPRSVRRYLSELLGHGPIDLLPPDGTRVEFDLGRISTGAPRVDRARLESLGREDMSVLDVDELFAGMNVSASATNEPLVREIAQGSASRVALFGELRLVLEGPGAGDLSLVIPIAMSDLRARQSAETAFGIGVRELRAQIEAGFDDSWAAPFLGRCRIAGEAAGLQPRELLQSLRVALTGTKSGPRLELVLGAIGVHEALRRLHVASMVLEETVGGNEAVSG